MATYADRDTLSGDGRSIALTARQQVVREYSKAFEHIWSRARDVRADGRSPTEAAEALAQEVFGPVVTSIRPMPQRSIEMSRYIDLEDYDQHEGKHAYYQEMMDCMLRLVSGRREGPLRVLELGAGTGLFTQRLLSLPAVSELHAIELDWACYTRLRRKFKDVSQKRLALHSPSAL